MLVPCNGRMYHYVFLESRFIHFYGWIWICLTRTTVETNHLLRQRKKGQKYRREIVSVNHLYINEGMIANFITFFQWFLFPIENIVDIVNPFKLWSNYRVTFTLLKYGWEKGKRKCWNFANNWSSVLFLFHLEREMCFALLPF